MTAIKIESKSKMEPAESELTRQWQPFPIDLLPPTMRNIAVAVQDAIGLQDGSTTAIATLATVSGVIGASCKIQIKPGYLQPGHLYTAIIGKSGQAKSATKESLLDPLQDKQTLWYQEWKCNHEEYEAEMVKWKSAKKGERPEYPIEPDPPKRIIVSDITIEAVGLRLKENPLGLLLYNDELETFFGGMGRYNKGNDLPHWLSIHNGKPLTIDRKGGDYIRIANPSVAIVGGIQPSILKNRLVENPDYFHSGFLARFLLAMPPVEPIFLNDNFVSRTTQDEWTYFLQGILQQRESAQVESKVVPHIFPIELAAWNILTEYQRRHALSATFSDEGESALEGKFLTNAARIALILHVTNQMNLAYPNLSDCRPIPDKTMLAACKIAEWFIDESKRIYAALAGEPVDGELTIPQREVMKVLARVGTALTKDEMKKRSRPCQRLDEERQLDNALTELVTKGKIRDKFRDHAGAGRKPIEYEIFSDMERNVIRIQKNTGENSNFDYVTPVTTEKNDFCPLPEFADFA